MKEEHYKKLNDPNKIKVNNKIGELISINPEFAKGTAVILDAEKMLTLNTLIKYGYPKNKIDIVNCIPQTYATIKRKHKSTFNMYLSDYIDMIKDYNGEISTAFFDYCCSVEGNENIRPLNDIHKYFNYKLPAHYSLLAVTLCFRTSKVNEEGMYEALTKLDKTIQISAYNNGYIALKEDGLAYKGGMFFVIYNLEEIQDDRF